MTYELDSVSAEDVPRLQELLSLPPVYQFLCDGEPPPRSAVEAWVSAAVVADPPLGLWSLVDAEERLCGLARLSEVEDGAASAELTYVVHPDLWGQGLATSMSRAVLVRAFEVPACEAVLAGADLPNARSVEVMKRLGMRLLRHVEYPAGPGVEYVIDRAGFAEALRGPTVPFRE